MSTDVTTFLEALFLTVKHPISGDLTAATPEDPKFGEAEAILVWPNENAGSIMDKVANSLRGAQVDVWSMETYRELAMSSSYERLLFITERTIETVRMP